MIGSWPEVALYQPLGKFYLWNEQELTQVRLVSQNSSVVLYLYDSTGFVHSGNSQSWCLFVFYFNRLYLNSLFFTYSPPWNFKWLTCVCWIAIPLLSLNKLFFMDNFEFVSFTFLFRLKLSRNTYFHFNAQRLIKTNQPTNVAASQNRQQAEVIIPKLSVTVELSDHYFYGCGNLIL